MASQLGPEGAVNLLGGVIVAICFFFTSGLGKLGTLIGAVGGIFFSSSGVGTLIQNLFFHAAGAAAAPNPYNIGEWLAIGAIGFVGIILIGLPAALSKGAIRTAVIASALGGILLASSSVGQAIFTSLTG
jgi:hypothetical protein